MTARTFYPEGSPGPATLPPFVVTTPTGAWACASQEDAIDLRDTLHGAGIKAARILAVAR